MAKEKPAADAEEKRLKKEKKEQKKRSETDGVRKPSSASSTKKEKSDKKAKKHKDPSSKTKTDKGETRNGEANGGGGIKKEEEQTAAAAADADDMMMTTQLLNTLEAEKPGSVVVKEQDGDVDVKVKTVLRGALVPFANPLADEKVGRKVLKGVKRGIYHLPPPFLFSIFSSLLSSKDRPMVIRFFRAE